MLAISSLLTSGVSLHCRLLLLSAAEKFDISLESDLNTRPAASVDNGPLRGLIAERTSEQTPHVLDLIFETVALAFVVFCGLYFVAVGSVTALIQLSGLYIESSRPYLASTHENI